MQKNKLFNPWWNDNLDARTIIKWNTTWLLNLNSTKYSWAKNMYQVMIGNFWVPEKVTGLGEDARIFHEVLNNDEKDAYKWILSFLIFLDSVQTFNLPNFSDYITSPEVNLLLAIQTYQEAIHSQSYATILETIVDSEERDEIYYKFRDDVKLLERNTYIWEIYEEFKNNPTEETFFKSLVANFILESLYFYNWFAFFDTLADSGKMLATQRMISYIRRDELTHVTLFSNIIREIKKEFPEIYSKEVILEMFTKWIEWEIEWAKHILGPNISGLSFENTEKYTKWLANNRLEMLGIEPLFPEVTVNPYKHLDRLQDTNSEKWNFFESTVVNYTQSSSMKWSWDF